MGFQLLFPRSNINSSLNSKNVLLNLEIHNPTKSRWQLFVFVFSLFFDWQPGLVTQIHCKQAWHSQRKTDESSVKHSCCSDFTAALQIDHDGCCDNRLPILQLTTQQRFDFHQSDSKGTLHITEFTFFYLRWSFFTLIWIKNKPLYCLNTQLFAQWVLP